MSIELQLSEAKTEIRNLLEELQLCCELKREYQESAVLERERLEDMIAKTNAERQREFRQRKADTEAVEVRGIFAHPDDHAEVKEAAAKIARRRVRLAKRGAP